MQPFHDVRAQYLAHRAEIDAALRRVLEGGHYLLGPELARFEAEFAAWLGVGHVIGVDSGTAAIELALRALDVGPGDEVIVPAMTAAPTAMAVISTGATPCVVDVQAADFGLSPAAARRALSPRTKAIVPVHLYGQCAEMDALLALGREAGVPVVEDAAQAHGATFQGRKAGTLARAACFSFYPTKNLGAFGDAGAVATDDEQLAARVRRLRNYGRPGADYAFQEPGPNARLDDLHAAVLGVKLPHLDAWNARRRAHAEAWRKGLAGTSLRVPEELPGRHHVYHQFAVRCARRDELRAQLATQGVETAIHYPAALHELDALRGRARVPEPPREAERVAREVLSLPIYPELPPEHLERAIAAVRALA
jgi:dTDP-3-amino-3,4,6-trideoxy-alpha-D-glucose transaminase